MINKKLNFISAIMRLRTAFHALNTVAALYDVSKKEWLRCISPDDDSHYIADYHQDGRKADAIINYTTTLAAVYMKASGALPGTLSKETLASDNAITVAIMRRMGGMEIKTNEEMFMQTATRLLGIDSGLVKAGITTDEVRYSHLVTYLVAALGEEFSEDSMKVLSDYIIRLGRSDNLNDKFFTELLQAGDVYYAEHPDSISDAIDIVDLLVDQLFAAKSYGDDRIAEQG